MLKSKLMIGTILALLASLAWGAFEHQRAERYKVAAKSAESQVAGLVVATTSKDAVIAEFITATDQAQKIIEDQKISLDKASGRVQTLRSQLDESRRQLQILEEADHEDATCNTLLTTPVAMCPGYFRGMQHRASGSLQGSNSADTAAGVGTDRLPTDDGLPPEVRPSSETDR